MRDREPRGCPPAARLGHRAARLSHRRHHGLGSRRLSLHRSRFHILAYYSLAHDLAISLVQRSVNSFQSLILVNFGKLLPWVTILSLPTSLPMGNGQNHRNTT